MKKRQQFPLERLTNQLPLIDVIDGKKGVFLTWLEKELRNKELEEKSRKKLEENQRREKVRITRLQYAELLR